MSPPPPPPTVSSFLPLIRPFRPTDTRHVRGLVGRDVLAMRSRASWQVYTNPIPLFSLIPLALLALLARSNIPFIASHTPFDLSFILIVLLGAITVFVVLVQRTHHRLYDGIVRRKLGGEDLGNVVQFYGLDRQGGAVQEGEGGREPSQGEEQAGRGGVVLVLPIDGSLRGVICIERKANSSKDDRPAYRIRHLVLDLPERTRRQAATALLTCALDIIFGPVPSEQSSPAPSAKNTRTRTKINDTRKSGHRVTPGPLVYAMTDPLALEGERFYHEMGFDKMNCSPAGEVNLHPDSGLHTPAKAQQASLGALGLLGAATRVPLAVIVPRGKRAWMEVSRDEWYTSIVGRKEDRSRKDGRRGRSIWL